MKINFSQLAEKHGTPIFIIDLDKLENKYNMLFQAAFKANICYSVKTNPHPAILNVINNLGGKIVVASNKELKHALEHSFHPERIIYHPIADKNTELEYALKNEVFIIIANSINATQKIASICNKLTKPAKIGLRINSKSLLNIKGEKTKFGISVEDINIAKSIIQSSKFLSLSMLCCHIGTNIYDEKLYSKVFFSLKDLCGGHIEHINIGGGFPSTRTLVELNKNLYQYLNPIVKKITEKDFLYLEPGRFLVEDSCYCISKVVSVNRNWVLLDISSNFLVPLGNADYIINTRFGDYTYNFAGRLCFGADIIKKNVYSDSITEGDIIIIEKCGAYTYSMKNNMGYDDPLIILKQKDELTIA